MDDRCQKHDRFVLKGGCPARAFEEVDVRVPVAVRAHANVGNVEFRCMGPAVIRKDCNRGPCCPVSTFTVSQRMRVDIPINFGAQAEVGEECVSFSGRNERFENDEDEKCNCGCR